MNTIDQCAIGDYVTVATDIRCFNAGDVLRVVEHTIEVDLNGNTFGALICRDENGDLWTIRPQQLNRSRA